MKENLEIENHEMIKTFSFDANEEYTTKVSGQGITTGTKLETMPNFVGKSVSEVETWATNHNITLHTEFVNNTSSYYNPNIAPGLISNQNISDGILLNNVSELTIYINSISTNNDKPTTPNDDNNYNDKPSEDDNLPNDEQTEEDNPLDDILPSDDNDEENDNSESSESTTPDKENENHPNENQSQ